jgi:hypothetical protein
MAASNERSALAEVSKDRGWSRHVDERVDVYSRGLTRVRVIWRGEDFITGGSKFSDELMETYSSDPATVKGWLAR